jgi:opacity protein-like surface antigen
VPSTRVRCSLLCLASVMTLASAAAAQPADFGQAHSSRPIRLMIGGGASLPVGEFGDRYDAGYTVQGALLINFAGFPINLRTDVNYSNMKLKDLFIPGGQTSYGDDATKILGGLLSLTLPLGSGPVRPYIMAGLGAFNVDPAQVSASPTKSSVEFAINGGAGFQLRLFGLEAFVEARLNNVYTDKGIIDTKGIQMVPLTFGVIF